MFCLKRMKSRGYAIVCTPDVTLGTDGLPTSESVDLAVFCPVNAPNCKSVSYVFPLFAFGCDLMSPIEGYLDNPTGANKCGYDLSDIGSSDDVRDYVSTAFKNDASVLSAVQDKKYSLDDFLSKMSQPFYTKEELAAGEGISVTFSKVVDLFGGANV